MRGRALEPDSDVSFQALVDEELGGGADVHAVDLRPERSVEIGSVEGEQNHCRGFVASNSRIPASSS